MAAHGSVAPYSGPSPTVRSNPGFNPEEGAKALRKAMKGVGTDEGAVIDVLASCATVQRVQLKDKYKVLYGKDLVDDLKSELGGNFEALVVALLQTPPEFDASSLRAAMKGAGTDERVLAEIMCTRSNAEIGMLKASYSAQFRRDLEKDIMSETSGTLRRLLVSCSVGGRSEDSHVDAGKAKADAQALQAAGVGSWGTDESEFNRILMTTSSAMLHAIDAEYSKLTGYDLIRSIEKEMSGDVAKAFSAVVQCMRDPAVYFAEKMHNAMSGAGTDDETLIRCIVMRAERDMGDIKARYLDKYKKTLGKAVKDDCSGDYKKLLIRLIGD